ncbi:unnamed protein product [Adineta steineri]|uniref:Neurotransmitter-gated ion-channel ligand-binding domain-containing protein n=1 Tax=Adineta steineri TaxID=433720 RepID=A0A815ALY7_9BILA|nr:unnamed protein product [Adineta steineri]CAF1548456.1 unnamed protein product [Adineta steineri]
MIKLVAFFILLNYLFYFCDCGSLPASQATEQTLITGLLSSYNKNIRPNTIVSIDITAALQQIVAIDEKQQTMTTSSFISQTWVDSRLSWTPSSNGNIDVVMLPVTSLWIPDTMILNSADSSGYLTVSTYSLASVESTGQVYMILPALTVKTRCNFNVQYFPFDKQVCSISLTSWSQGSSRLVYTENSTAVIDISGYTEHPLWKLNGTDMVVIRSADRTPFEDTYNDVITIQLYLQRKPLYFIMNGIFACWILNCVTLLSYTLPFGSQIGLCMTCFMTYSVYSLNFSNLFPQQSQYLMMITLYFMLSICWTLISMIWFVICNHFISKAEMPKFLYIFAGQLQKKVFLFCFPPPKDDKKKDVIVNNDELKKSEDKESIQATIIQEKKCASCQKLLPSCFRWNTKVVTIEKKEQPSLVKDDTLTKINNHYFTLVDKPELVTMDKTNEKPKPTCDFCDRCETCQADFDKDKAKGKNKKDIEGRCSALNYFIFLIVLLFITVAELSLWISMANN